NWAHWASRALNIEPYWEVDASDRYRQLAVKVQAAVWPNVHEEFERSLRTFSEVLVQATDVFWKHAEYRDDHILGPKFYNQLGEWNPERYKQRGDEWEEWLAQCQGLIFEATKAANWFADCVRKYINPRFFATDGKFRLDPSWVHSDIAGLYVPEYIAEERS